ncbi:MAG: hypothetical protein Q8R25_02565, partial [bacterium]|nr:hypothetical protein [bacterium]
IEVFLSPPFDRLIRRLDPPIREAVSETIAKFKNEKNHKQLKVHTLHGNLMGLHAFSIDYRHRIVFQWIGSFGKKRALLLDFGDHSVYE